MTKTSILALLVLGTFAGPASANLFELRAVYPQDETMYLDANGAVEAPLIIRLKTMGSAGISTPMCDAVIDFGDQTPVKPLRLGEDGRVQSEVRHRYAAAGQYTVSVRGAATRTPCDGSTKGTLNVLAASERPTTPVPVPVNAQAAAAALPTITLETTPTSTAETCPSGWFLVPGSMSGGRFTCHLAAVKAFNCPTGTRFFDSGNTVGCR
ncbi:MAG TPA: hypothetical protein VLC92_19615 [Rhodocyclaceae bacterium]|nr:hypothetical protein [Rhodocyclaceae bacterium]